MVFKGTPSFISKAIRFLISLLLIYVIYIIIMKIFQAIQQKKYLEGFLTSGDYPVAVDKPLLYDSYNVMERPGASPLGAAQIYLDDYIFPAHSVKSNNLRYWTLPTNGQCTAPDMCEGLYKPTQQQMFVSSAPPQWNNERRVNFQVASNAEERINQ